MKSKWIRKNNEMTCPKCAFVYYDNKDDFNFCPACGIPMNPEAGVKMPIVWHDAKTDPPKDDGIYKLVVLNGKSDNITFENSIAVAAYYQMQGKSPAEWDIEFAVNPLRPSRLVTHWAELPEVPEVRDDA